VRGAVRHAGVQKPAHERTFASTANSVPWRTPGVLFGVLSRWTIARLLGGPNHRLDANLHISFGGSPTVLKYNVYRDNVKGSL
jgi:hypothetical protein